MTGPDEQTSQCWWCYKDADGPSKANFEMYGDVQRQSAGANATKLTWKSVKVPIARCAWCATRHNRSGRLPLLLAVVFGAVACLVIYLSTSDWMSDSRSDTKVWIVVFLVIVVVSAFVGSMIGKALSANMMRKAGTRPYGEAAQHPAVAALIADGWKVGRPSKN